MEKQRHKLYFDKQVRFHPNVNDVKSRFFDCPFAYELGEVEKLDG